MTNEKPVQVGASTNIKGSQGNIDTLHVRKVVARNPNTPKQVLARLLDDSDSNVRHGIASNPKTDEDLLRKLAKDIDKDVRLAVAENPNTPPDTLTVLSCDEDVDVRFGVAENPHMPENILVKLSQDENAYVRCRALKTLQIFPVEIQERLKMLLNENWVPKHNETQNNPHLGI